jgi:sugar lactone lactonase YvrE
MQTWSTGKPWLETHCALGEGPFYEKETDSVRFVDIINKRLHVASLATGELQTTQFDECVTVTADIEGVDPRERILVGIKRGLAVLDRKTNELTLLSTYASERLRSNDGAADPPGRFWLGTMTDFPYGDVQPEGSLFQISASGDKTEVLKDIKIPNSIGFSPDARTLYFTDTIENKVLAMDYDPATGAVSNKRVHYTHTTAGGPDGFRVDVNGDIWHAFYGGACVLKISGKDGSVIGRVDVPTNNVTCVRFVGTELVITTASDDEGQGGEESKKYGGAVFRVDVGVEGLDLYKFKM